MSPIAPELKSKSGDDALPRLELLDPWNLSGRLQLQQDNERRDGIIIIINVICTNIQMILLIITWRILSTISFFVILRPSPTRRKVIVGTICNKKI